MKFFYDTEFYEDGKEIHLISIGIVAQDGRELYLENSNFDWNMVPIDHWLWDNVYPHLEGNDSVYGETRFGISERVQDFIVTDSPEEKHELWGYYSSYDHVVLAQLWGVMVNLPRGIPMFTHDLKQVISMNWEYIEYNLDVDPIPLQDGVEHHALADARWNKKVYYWLEDME